MKDEELYQRSMKFLNEEDDDENEEQIDFESEFRESMTKLLKTLEPQVKTILQGLATKYKLTGKKYKEALGEIILTIEDDTMEDGLSAVMFHLPELVGYKLSGHRF